MDIRLTQVKQDVVAPAEAKAETGHIGFIADAAGCSQADDKPLVFDPEAQTRGEARTNS